MEGRNNLFWKVLFSLLIMAVYGSCSAAYAAEFGGFEVSTGTGEYEGTGEEWEDEPVCNTPEQNDSNTYVDEARNDGQESEQNTSGTVSSYNEEYEQVPVQNWNARESSTTTEKNRSSVTEYTERYRGENENVSSSIMDEDRIIKSEYGSIDSRRNESDMDTDRDSNSNSGSCANSNFNTGIYRSPERRGGNSNRVQGRVPSAACRMSAKNETLMFETGIGKGRICRNSNQEECSGRNCKCTC